MEAGLGRVKAEVTADTVINARWLNYARVAQVKSAIMLSFVQTTMDKPQIMIRIFGVPDLFFFVPNGVRLF